VENEVRDDDVSLIALASKIDDDQPIDWDSEGEAYGDEERAVLAELRVLAALTRVYRDPEAVESDTGPQAATDPAQVPAAWGQLTVLEPVGKGGFARVYRARDALDRNVALKLFPVTPENASALASRVLREGSLLAKVKHGNVVVVHGVDQSKDFVGLWMEFIDGRTMEDELRARGPLSAEEATPIGVDLCRALAAVHGRGLVHRDVKAQNVMREDGGRTVLMDFGAGTELATGLRKSHDMAGTPLYLAPELFDGRQATRASDIYSLGVLLYHMVTRAYPVEGADRTEIERAHRAGEVKRLRDVRPDLPAGFIQAVESALSADPDARPQTAGAFEAALTGKNAPGRASDWTPWQRAAAIAAAVILVAVPVWWILSRGNGSTAVNDSPAAVTVPASPAATPVAPSVPYTVKATLFRSRDGDETPLTPGTRLVGGDGLVMHIEASTDVYVYLINADDAGKSYRLFPLPDRKPDNPLERSKNHRLPSDDHNWQVTSEGGREHFVVMVSPTRDEAIDAIVRAIPPAVAGRNVERASIPPQSIGVLRGVGGLARKGPDASATGPTLLWYDTAEILSGRQETASGAWMRKLTVSGSAR
jgi:eukaryotic-like serine/threonine-protein kinase